jgi:hypothetical protein
MLTSSKSHATLWELGGNIGLRRSLMEAQKNIEPIAALIFTDPDFLLPAPPDPFFLTLMFDCGRQFEKLKVGLALDVSESENFTDVRLSAAFNNRTIREWERKFWRNELEENVYAAAVDKTFFLHVPAADPTVKTLAEYGKRQARIPALRIFGPGYIAKHRPWYVDDCQSDDEREFYIKLVSSVATWSNAAKNASMSTDQQDGSNYN